MDSIYRLKIQHQGSSFEAEGDKETVNEQFRAFQELIRSPIPPPAPIIQTPVDETKGPTDVQPANNSVPFNEQSLSKIMKVEGRIVSLTVHPPSVQDALLLIVYGQKVLRQNELCSGGELLSGLVTTGGYSMKRVDRTLHNMGLTGDLIITGEHRGKKYRLANTGLGKVRQIASDLLATVA